jgi:hypothetical protein
MGNVVKYSLSSQPLSLKVGNFYIGTGDVGKGPTSVTDYWAAYDPVFGGFTLYLNKAANGPSIYSLENSDILINFINTNYDQSFTELGDCLEFLRSDPSRFVLNQPIPPFITSGLTTMFDFSLAPSNPRAGNTTYDLSTNAFSGSATNLVYTPNNNGVALFDGSTSFLGSIGAVSSFSYIQNTGVFTISMGVKPSALGTEMYFIGNNGTGSTTKGFRIGRGASDNIIFQITKGVSETYIVNVSFPGFFDSTSWVYLTITGNGTDWYLYKDDELFGSGIFTSSFSTGDSTQTLSIGKVGTTSTQYWDGAISNVLIYNKFFTESESLATYSIQSNTFGETELANQSMDSLATQGGDTLIIEEI